MQKIEIVNLWDCSAELAQSSVVVVGNKERGLS